MSNDRRRTRWVIPGVFSVIFVVSQGIALGARSTQLSNPTTAIAQGVAITAALFGVAYAVYVIQAGRLLKDVDRFASERTDLLWLGAGLHETQMALSRIRGKKVRLGLLFLIEVEDGILTLRKLPDGGILLAAPVAEIGEIAVGRSMRLGVSNECLFVAFESEEGLVNVPLVLARTFSPTSWLVQGEEQLQKSARQLRTLLQTTSTDAPERAEK